MKKIFILITVVIVSACSGNKTASPTAPSTASPAGTIAGTLANKSGPMQNAEVTLKVYQDENCVKLGQQSNLPPEQKAQFERCRKQLSATNSDVQGKYSFANVADGWYALTVNWTTKEDPVPNNPMWKPLILYRADDFLITFIAAKDGSFHMLAVGEPFQFQSRTSTEKNLTLKL